MFPTSPRAPISVAGDLWTLGPHTLLVGDATNEADVARLMNGAAADLVFTDLPYNVNYEGYTEDHLTIQGDRMSDADFKQFLAAAFQCYRSIVKLGASLYVCHPSSWQREFQNAMEAAGFEIRCQIIWAKNTFAWGFGRYKFQHEPIFNAHVAGQTDAWYGDKSQSTLWQENKPAANRLHPTMKPVDHVHQHEGHQERQERNLTSDHLAEGVLGQSRDLGQRDDWDRDRPEGDGGGVGYQCHSHRLDRPEAEAHQHHPTDRHGRAEAGEGLEQGTEAESDDDHLDALVVGHRAERPAQDGEVPGLHRHVVDPQRVDDDPHDREEAERRTLRAGVESLPERHPVDGDRHHHRHGQGDQRSPLGLHPHTAQQHEQRQQRNHGEDRRGPQRMGHRIKDLLVHRSPSRPTVAGRLSGNGSRRGELVTLARRIRSRSEHDAMAARPWMI